jgi:hypothetical protein
MFQLLFLTMTNKPKKRYNRQRSHDKPYTPDKPFLRDIRNYPIRRQQQVLLFLVHHWIPPGLTSHLQPLDTAVNGPFKKLLQQAADEYIEQLESEERLPEV